MRNLKKVLGLALCIAVMLSVMVVGAGAAFTDTKDIDSQHQEAVDMAVALNIIDGKPDGSFAPKENVTREQMAKMICVLDAGGKDPQLGTGSTFTDVPATKWSSKYIEACASRGVVDGVGNNMFDPEGNVTGTQAARMLLVELGYDQDRQGYVGSNWAVNVNVNATQKGYYEDLEDIDPNAPLTREHAAQMIWNALQATEVEYSYTLVGDGGNLSSQVKVQDRVWSTTSGIPKAVTLMADKYGVKDDATGDLAAFTYNSDKHEWTYTFNNRENGLPATVTSSQNFTDLYKQNVKVVYSTKNDGTSVDKVFGMYGNDSVVLATAYAGDFDSVKAADDSVKINSTSYDLQQAASATQVYDFTYGTNTVLTDTIDKYIDAQANMGYQLVAVDYEDDGDINFFVAYPFVVDQVNSVGTKNFTLKDTAGTFKFEDVVAYDNMDEDDFVVYTPAKNSATNDDTFVKVDTVLKGDVTATKGNYKLAVDGTWYEATYSLTAGDTTGSVTKDKIAVGDSVKDAPVVNGYVYAASATGTTDVNDYAVVVGVDKGGYGSTAKLMFADGSKVVVDTDKYYSSLDNQLVYYEINSDDEYELTLASSMKISDTGFDKATSTFKSSDMNSSKKIKYIDGNNINNDATIFMNDNGDYKVVTGSQLKAIKGDGITSVFAYVDENSSTGYDSVVMAYVVTNKDTVSADKTYGFVLADPVSVKNSDNKTVYEIQLWTQDGTALTLNTKDGLKVDSKIKEGAIVEYGVNGDNVFDTMDFQAALGTGSKSSATAAITSYDGTYVSFDDATTRHEVTKDSTIAYINVADSEGAEGGSIKKASKDASSGYYHNAWYVLDDGDIDVMFIDINNDIDDSM